MTAADKDTIYIDIDDEITGIIDKLRGSNGKIVALVLPKRASVLQSIVNMKLLKRAADEAQKHLVLVTSEAGLLPLAGATDIMVAKTLTSKPAVPAPPQTNDDQEETIDEDDGETPDFSKEAVAGTAVGALAAKPPVTDDDGVETLELDDDSSDPAEDDVIPAAPTAGAKVKVPKAKKDKHLAVPNFERFRTGLVLAILAVPVIIIALIWAFSWAPKATISITTNAVNVNADFNMVLDTGAKTVDTSTNTVPAKLVQQQKTYTQQGSASGQKNTGDKAQGQVKFINCSSGDSVDIPAGTAISAGGLTYVTQDDAVMPAASKTCHDIPGSTSDTVAVKALIGGSNYNAVSGTPFTVSKPSDGSYDPSVIKATANGAVSGGTDTIVQIVTQTDIDNAKAKINTADTTVKQALNNQLAQAGYFAVGTSFSSGTPTITTSANVGDAASNVTVTEVVSYTMFGAKESDLDKLVDKSVTSQIDPNKQSILSEGLSSATFGVTTQDTKTAQISFETVATAGPDLNVDTIKQQAAGQKAGDVKGAIENDPGVTGVNVKFSPFWVSSVPKKTSKITVDISKPAAPSKNGN